MDTSWSFRSAHSTERNSKFQTPSSKQIQKSNFKIQNYFGFKILVIRICLRFGICDLGFPKAVLWAEGLA
jgi:hypothetical protein